MRRLAKLIMMLLLLAALLITPSRPAVEAATPCGTALQACTAQYNAEVQMCDELPGESFTDCVCRALRLWNSCVVAHGCPGLKRDMETTGCADN